MFDSHPPNGLLTIHNLFVAAKATIKNPILCQITPLIPLTATIEIKHSTIKHPHEFLSFLPSESRTFLKASPHTALPRYCPPMN